VAPFILVIRDESQKEFNDSWETVFGTNPEFSSFEYNYGQVFAGLKYWFATRWAVSGEASLVFSDSFGETFLASGGITFTF